MFLESFMQTMVELIIKGASQFFFPLMLCLFGIGISLRLLIWYTVKRHDWFSMEFEKRVSRYFELNKATQNVSFYVAVKKIMERTFYEVFENRAKLRRRKPDFVMALSDRIFLIQHGSAWIVRDVLRQIRHLRREEPNPNLVNITKNTFYKNPCFNKVFGVLPVSGASDFVNILPGLFVIGGIFGTFIGIRQGLPMLGEMDLSNIEQTKTTMDQFLIHIAFSMGASLVGILLSIITQIMNTLFSPEALYEGIIERFEANLHLLWNHSSTNVLPEASVDFNEHRDPMEALAEEALNLEISKSPRGRKSDLPLAKEEKETAA